MSTFQILMSTCKKIMNQLDGINWALKRFSIEFLNLKK